MSRTLWLLLAPTHINTNVLATGASVSYTYTGLTNGTLYNFEVTASNRPCTSAPSNVALATPNVGVTAIPAITAVANPGAGFDQVTFISGAQGLYNWVQAFFK